MNITGITKQRLIQYPLSITLLSSFLAAPVYAEHPAPLELDDMQVLSGHTAPATQSIEAAQAELQLTPGGVSFIDIDELSERNVSSLADMLRYVPGIFSASDSGNDNIFFTSRGSNLDATDYDMNGIKLLQDGLPVTSADGNNHNRIIDPLSARYAMVARGANALKYGASTLGGAINFTTQTAYDTEPLTLSLNAGSHGQVLARATASKIFSNQFDGLITIEDKQWDGYRDHNEQDRHGVYANAGWRISDSVASRFYATYLENDQELSGTLTKAEVKADRDQASSKALGGNYQINVGAWRLANKTTWDIDENSRFELGFSYEEQDLYHPIVDKIMVDFDGPGPMSPVEVFSLLINTEQRDFATTVRYQKQLAHHDLLFGINYADSSVEGGHYRNDSGRKNGLSKRIDNDASTIEAYLMDRWQISEQWKLILAAQAVSAKREVRETTVSDNSVRNPDDSYHSINPRFGTIYNMTDSVSLFANVSRLYEPPTNFELQDEVSGSSGTLDAMHGSVIEVGTRGSQKIGQASNWSWDMSIYYAQLKDEILSIDDPSAPGTSLSTNVDHTIHAGIEAVVSSELAVDDAKKHIIAPMLSLTVNNFEFDGDVLYGDNDLPAAPKYVLKGEILYRNVNGFYVGPTFDVVDERYADFANTYKVDSYALFGLRAGWSNDKIRLFAEVKNLFDKDYIASHSVKDIAAADADILNPGEPLSAYVGIELKL